MTGGSLTNSNRSTPTFSKEGAVSPDSSCSSLHTNTHTQHAITSEQGSEHTRRHLRSCWTSLYLCTLLHTTEFMPFSSVLCNQSETVYIRLLDTGWLRKTIQSLHSVGSQQANHRAIELYRPFSSLTWLHSMCLPLCSFFNGLLFLDLSSESIPSPNTESPLLVSKEDPRFLDYKHQSQHLIRVCHTDSSGNFPPNYPNLRTRGNTLSIIDLKMINRT